jgi:hypothetical protein
METIVYFSRNGKKPPYEVTIQLEGQLVYINCNCSLGIEKKICRHKINAIRGDKEKRDLSTPDEAINRLRRLFGVDSTLRQHLEEKWRLLREYATENENNEGEIDNKRRILGEAFANGFLNDNPNQYSEPFDADEWEGRRNVYADELNCHITLKYIDYEGEITTREVQVNEIFVNNSQFYILGYCYLRKHKRTFRIDRILSVTFHEECSESEKSKLLDVIFQRIPSAESTNKFKE